MENIRPHGPNRQNELQAACAEWIAIDSVSFNTLRGKGFQRFMKKIDPRFKPPSNKLCKDLIIANCQDGIIKFKEKINETCEYAAITTDLWTARSKFGYIGITVHWLTPNFEIIDMLLTIERMQYPHTAERIHDYLNNKMHEFGLNEKLFIGVTDNGSNMKKAFMIWEDIERLPCSAHMLQLSVVKGLKKITPYVKRFKKLVKFFTKSVKQSERLDAAQIDLARQNHIREENVEILRFNELSNLDMDQEIGSAEEEEVDESTIKILRNRSEVCTRWNSSYYSWARLLELKDAIIWLASVLPLKKGNENKKDGQILSRLLLKDYEWDLLKRIVDALKPFELATTFFSGSKYPTLSLMYPTIRELQNQYIVNLYSDEISNSEDDEDDNGKFLLGLYYFLTTKKNIKNDYKNLNLFIYL